MNNKRISIVIGILLACCSGTFAQANDRPTQANDRPTQANDRPTQANDRPTQANDRPNIILMMADDLGYGDTGFNGNTIIQTPHLDALAKRGVVLQNFHAGSSVCSPTRGTCRLAGNDPAGNQQ